MQRNTNEMPISKIEGKQRFVILFLMFVILNLELATRYKMQKYNLRTVFSDHVYVNVFFVPLLSSVLCYSN